MWTHWTRVLYYVVITWQSNLPISQFNSPCNEHTSVWSMFVYNTILLLFVCLETFDVTVHNETLTLQSPMKPWRHNPQWNLDVTVPNEPLTSQSPMTPCILLTGIFVVWYMYRIVNTGLISTEALTDILALYVGLMYNHVFSDKSFTYTGYRVIQVDRTAAVPTGCVTIELHVYNTYTLFSFFFLYFSRNPRVTREL